VRVILVVVVMKVKSNPSLGLGWEFDKRKERKEKLSPK
jgi:hypothetical protein